MASTTPWLSAVQQKIWRSFLGATTVLNERLDRDLRAKHGISLAEYEILVRLSESSDHSVRMAELAEAVAHSRSRITHTVSRLEKMNLVERNQSTKDGRGVRAHLCDRGARMLEEAAPTHVTGVHEYLIEGSTDHDLEAFGRVMENVRHRLDGPEF